MDIEEFYEIEQPKIDILTKDILHLYMEKMKLIYTSDDSAKEASTAFIMSCSDLLVIFIKTFMKVYELDYAEKEKLRHSVIKYLNEMLNLPN